MSGAVFAGRFAGKVLVVTGAANDNEARIAAKNIVENNLVKCSWYGGDPYWGRLMAAAGSAGVDLDVTKSHVAYGGIKVAKGVEPTLCGLCRT